MIHLQDVAVVWDANRNTVYLLYRFIALHAGPRTRRARLVFARLYVSVTGGARVRSTSRPRHAPRRIAMPLYIHPFSDTSTATPRFALRSLSAPLSFD